MNKGCIRISEKAHKEMWSDIYIFMKYFRPTHIENRTYEGIWLFYGESNQFDELQEGEIVPEYDVVFTRFDEGGYDVKFHRKNV